MKKILSLLSALLMLASIMVGCANQTGTKTDAETLKGVGKGFGGEVTVTVTKEGDKIVNVEAVGENETEGVGTKAIQQLPQAIVNADSTDVDVVGGATITSNAIIYAVNNALDPENYPTPGEEEKDKDPVENPVEENPVGEAGEIVKMGLGQNISIAKSKDASSDSTAQGQADVTVAAVGFDSDGKVVSASIDVAQTKVAFDKEMNVTSDKTKEVPSKKDLGDKYGMVGQSQIGKEWYEQIEDLENWMVGKTIDEITSLKTKVRDENHQAVPDAPELTSSVTISVEDYLEAVKEAWENSVPASGAKKVGLGVETHINNSKDKTEEVLPVAQIDTYMSAAAVDDEGKVMAAKIDTAQVKIQYDADGKVTSDKAAEIKTKQELKEKYGMINASEIKKEWYEQMTAFQDWMKNKTSDEIKGLKTKVKDEEHPAVPDVPELTSSVTISVEKYQSVADEAIANAK